ncbi:O-antigen ligase [Rheinheimera sp.]|uniref:O-antigen ligase family protein n=1 Tax=Rheinheimera sp. TaxID=1869214 RepID=UPI0027327A85|nr:O-antigen ligase family protein [Rheinheimera sp.]MDP2715748.1 O-antigen ligase family protein [Rheinheimera sp.]
MFNLTAFANHPFVRMLSIFVLFMCFFTIDSSFRSRDFDEKTLDFQVLIKLFILFFSLVLGSISLLKFDFYQRFFLVLVFVLYILITALWSENSLYTLSIFLSFISILLFITFFLDFYGRELFIKIVCLSLLFFLFLSVLTYFLNPELGRFHIWENGSYVTTMRMSGLTTSANNFARICAVYILFLYFYNDLVRKVFKNNLVLLQWMFAIACLGMSGSRTTLAIITVCFSIAYFIRSGSGGRILYLGLSGLGISLLLAFFPFLIDFFSRDGGEDLTSFTGRMFIWDVVLYYISYSPIFGHGFGSSIYLLPELSDDIGFLAPHAHNMYLQILLSGGIFGLLFFIINCIFVFFYSVFNRSVFSFTSLLFILLVGFFESAAVSLVANMMTVLLFVSIYESRKRFV